mgnify:CR=1 FL=1
MSRSKIIIVISNTRTSHEKNQKKSMKSFMLNNIYVVSERL